MIKEELAQLLNGRQYREEMTRDLEAQAKEAGLVVVFGASDDLMEFRGAIHDEQGAPGYAFVDGKGLLLEREQIDENDDATLGDYFARQKTAQQIQALWYETKPYAWSFKTDIPHATFDTVEDGEPFCRGIVFALADCVRPPAPRIYEPGDIADLDDTPDTVPHVDLIPQQLRVHFHSTGISFGLIDPRDDRFSVCIAYEKARSLLVEYAKSLNQVQTPTKTAKMKRGK